MTRTIVRNIIVSVVAILLVVLFVYYYFYYEKVNVTSLANTFCSCAKTDSTKTTDWKPGRDNFMYKSGLESCFKEEFQAACVGLTKREKEAYLIQIRDQVFELCRHEMSEMYEGASLYEKTKKTGHYEELIRMQSVYE